MRTVAIVGSRRWKDYDAFCEAMPPLGEYDRIVSGAAPGVDSLAELLARALGKEFKAFPPDQSKPFTIAAHERNQRIVDAADAMIAFPGPRSTGTWDAVRRAKKKGIPVLELKAPV
jgi:hypothetical protein